MSDLDTFSVVFNFGITLLVAFFVNSHYRDRQTIESERYSTFWPRFWSPSIDTIIFWPVSTLIPLFVLNVYPMAYNGATMLATLAYFYYSIYFHGKYGGTIGKLRCKIKVVDFKTEAPIDFKQAFIRDAIPLSIVVLFIGHAIYVERSEVSSNSQYMGYITAIYGFWFLAEIVTMLTNEKRRALHDFIAGTVVVRVVSTSDPISTEEVFAVE